jgi:hypothetical protein
MTRTAAGGIRLNEWLDGPQRMLSAEAVLSAVERLRSACAEKGVVAVLPEVCTCRGLLLVPADACRRSSARSAGQALLLSVRFALLVQFEEIPDGSASAVISVRFAVLVEFEPSGRALLVVSAVNDPL